MRSTTPRDLADHCKVCWLHREICLCDVVPRIETRTEILIVRHVAELRLTSNTARFAVLALPNARIVEYGGGPTFDERELTQPGSALLYSAGPRAPSRPASLEPAPRRLVVLDGSFRQTRRMYKRIEALRSLPELALPPPATAPLRLRQPPRADGMSTLEAIAHALGRLEGPATAAPLLELYAELVRRMDARRGRLRDALGQATS
jgi:DTW domain-containing protein YfiP